MKKFLLSSQSVLSALLLSARSPGPVDGEGSGLVTNDKKAGSSGAPRLWRSIWQGPHPLRQGFRDSGGFQGIRSQGNDVVSSGKPEYLRVGSFGGTLTIGSAYEEAPAYTSVPGNDCCHNSNFYGLHSEVHLLIMGREYGNPMPDKFSLFWGDEFEKKSTFCRRNL